MMASRDRNATQATSLASRRIRAQRLPWYKAHPRAPSGALTSRLKRLRISSPSFQHPAPSVIHRVPAAGLGSDG
jgi:hypothetical protein